MVNTTQRSNSEQQTTAWLRGLVAIAWADGHFDPEEQEIITSLLQQDLDQDRSPALEPISPTDLAAALGDDPEQAENFLRMAVMVALADRDYSVAEDELLEQYRQALGLQSHVLQVLRSTLQDIANLQPSANSQESTSLLHRPEAGVDVLHPVRDWLDGMDIHDPKVARFLCRIIPPQCPFERDIKVFGHKLVHIPPLCKLNPLYEQMVGLRFRALSYLADDCGEDISDYC